MFVTHISMHVRFLLVADTQSRVTSSTEQKSEIQSKITAAQDQSDLHRWQMLAKNERMLKVSEREGNTDMTKPRADDGKMEMEMEMQMELPCF